MNTTTSGKAKILQFHRLGARPKAAASIEWDGYAADIFHNPEIKPPTWHYIITRMDSSEILYWGQERSLEAAEKASRSTLGALAKKEVSLG